MWHPHLRNLGSACHPEMLLITLQGNLDPGQWGVYWAITPQRRVLFSLADVERQYLSHCMIQLAMSGREIHCIKFGWVRFEKLM